MKRIGDKGTDALTLVHKLVGLAWVVAAAGVLVLVVPGLASGEVEWSRVALLGRIGSLASVVTGALALVYALWTVWGFPGGRWVLAKWGLYLVAVATSGFATRAIREQSTRTLTALTAVELLALVAAMGVGVFLERSRHAGRLPR